MQHQAHWRLYGEITWEDPIEIYLTGSPTQWKKEPMIVFLKLVYRLATSEDGIAFYEQLTSSRRQPAATILADKVFSWNSSKQVRSACLLSIYRFESLGFRDKRYTD